MISIYLIALMAIIVLMGVGWWLVEYLDKPINKYKLTALKERRELLYTIPFLTLLGLIPIAIGAYITLT